MTYADAAPPAYLVRPDGLGLAYRHDEGEGPTIVFLPGYMSDMEGGKAVALSGWARAQGRAMLRLDYAGNGASEGRFADGTLASWCDDVLLLPVGARLSVDPPEAWRPLPEDSAIPLRSLTPLRFCSFRS